MKGRRALAVAALLTLASPTVASSARPSAREKAKAKDQSAERHHARPGADNAPEPPADDRDRDRIVRMQAALRDILRGGSGALSACA